MLNAFSRTELLIGKTAVDSLKELKVAIFGLGGVGSYTAEALARSGVGRFLLVDDDRVCLTNLNRQLIALRSTIGKPKVEVMKARILDINPKAEVEIKQSFYLPEIADTVLTDDLNYIVDAIDTVTAKIDLAVQAERRGIPIISIMGAGNKLDPTRFEVTDISKTSYCPLAKVMRRELKLLGIKSLKVVYSKEEPIKPSSDISANCATGCVCPAGTMRKCTARNSIPGSMSFVPPVAGLIAAGEVVQDLVKNIQVHSQADYVAVL